MSSKPSATASTPTKSRRRPMPGWYRKLQLPPNPSQEQVDQRDQLLSMINDEQNKDLLKAGKLQPFPEIGTPQIADPLG